MYYTVVEMDALVAGANARLLAWDGQQHTTAAYNFLRS